VRINESDHLSHLLISYSGHNFASRTRNSTIGIRHDVLSSFLDINTGQAIPNFLSTRLQVEELNSATLTDILRVLGLETAGLVLDKRIRLQEHIGSL
jgi:hypothetical protein